MHWLTWIWKWETLARHMRFGRENRTLRMEETDLQREEWNQAASLLAKGADLAHVPMLFLIRP